MAAWLWKTQPLEGATVMSELDVIVIHIRAEQAAEYERLFAERELPRWRDYKAPEVLSSTPGSPGLRSPVLRFHRGRAGPSWPSIRRPDR